MQTNRRHLLALSNLNSPTSLQWTFYASEVCGILHGAQRDHVHWKILLRHTIARRQKAIVGREKDNWKKFYNRFGVGFSVIHLRWFMRSMWLIIRKAENSAFTTVLFFWLTRWAHQELGWAWKTNPRLWAARNKPSCTLNLGHHWSTKTQWNSQIVIRIWSWHVYWQ